MVMVCSIEYGFCCQLWIAWLLCTGGVTYLGHTLYSGEYCLVGLIFPNCRHHDGSRVGVGAQVVNLLPLGRVGHRPVLPQPVSWGTLRVRHLPSAISCGYTSTWPALALMPIHKWLSVLVSVRWGY